ncbi:hypothetical protein AA313_de0205743 [Arthrobotrys entomopaga]|nr:hypothetical protein AA313_de0205743 [Arthrobotrys entomopaga]
MQIKSIIFALFASGPLAAFASNCAGSPGQPGGQCVQFYTGGGCSGNSIKYQPDCSGACYRYDSFTGIKASGDGYFGTNCAVFSDTNCQNQIGSTGNNVLNGGCYSKTGKSMKCYYAC